MSGVQRSRFNAGERAGTVKDFIERGAGLTTIIGIVVALITYIDAKRKEIRDREYGTYDALDRCYTDFLKMCFDKPELGVYGADEYLPDRERTFSGEHQLKRDILWLMLFSVLERAYLMHLDRSKVMERQWHGWDAFVTDHCRNPNFAIAWDDLGGGRQDGQQLETQFIGYINKRLRDVQNEESKA